MDEALKLADRIVVMKEGRIHQVASPEELLRNPKDEFVEQFVGRHRMVAPAESLTVGEIMIQDPVSARPDYGLAEAVATMRKRRVNSVLVVDEDGKLLGLVTARAIERGMARHRTLGEIMQTRLTTVQPHQPVTHAVQRMLLERLEFLPVVDEQGRLQGLVTNTSLVGTLSGLEEAERSGGATA